MMQLVDGWWCVQCFALVRLPLLPPPYIHTLCIARLQCACTSKQALRSAWWLSPVCGSSSAQEACVLCLLLWW